MIFLQEPFNIIVPPSTPTSPTLHLPLGHFNHNFVCIYCFICTTSIPLPCRHFWFTWSLEFAYPSNDNWFK